MSISSPMTAQLRIGISVMATAPSVWRVTGSFGSVALAPSMPAVARQLHRQHQFDLVHLHFPDPLGHLTALALPRTVRRVISWHSDIVKQKWALSLYSPFLRLLCVMPML